MKLSPWWHLIGPTSPFALIHLCWKIFLPSVSLVSDTGGSLATYWRPLNKFASTIGRLSSSWRRNALWSSCSWRVKENCWWVRWMASNLCFYAEFVVRFYAGARMLARRQSTRIWIWAFRSIHWNNRVWRTIQRHLDLMLIKGHSSFNCTKMERCAGNAIRLGPNKTKSSESKMKLTWKIANFSSKLWSACILMHER